MCLISAVPQNWLITSSPTSECNQHLLLAGLEMLTAIMLCSSTASSLILSCSSPAHLSVTDCSVLEALWWLERVSLVDLLLPRCVGPIDREYAKNALHSSLWLTCCGQPANLKSIECTLPLIVEALLHTAGLSASNRQSLASAMQRGLH